MIALRQTTLQQVPVRIHMIQDVSGSTQSELPTIQYETQRFAESVANRNNPYDFMRISAFSGYSNANTLEFESIPGYFQPANRALKEDACKRMRQWKSKGMTAIYDAVRIAHEDIIQIVRKAHYPSLNIVVVITDEEDNASRLQVSQMGFPSSYVHFAAIGVGRCSLSSLESLAAYATSTHHIYSFQDLFKALSIALLRIQERVIV